MATITVYIFALSDDVVSLTDYIPWGFVNIRYWSHIATWVLPLLPLAVLIGPLKNQRLWRFLVALGSALWWWIVFLSSSRGTMLGVVFGMLVVAILMGRLAMPWLKKSFRYLLYGVAAWFLLSVLIPSLLIDDVVVRSLKADSSGRMPLFFEAWHMSLVEFPFGMGPQSWLTHEIITEGYRQSPKFGHPHNMYLMWAAEYGWLMVASILVLAGQAMYLFSQRRKEIAEDGAKALALTAFTASVSAALLHAGVSAVFMAPGSMLVGFAVLSVFWVLISGERLDSKRKPTKRRTFAALVIALVGSGFCLVWINNVRDYHAAMTNDEQVYYDGPSVGMLPRFWFHGNFPRYGPTEKD
jgi:O-antigen ligase